jgi:hypothetical protein
MLSTKNYSQKLSSERICTNLKITNSKVILKVYIFIHTQNIKKLEIS